MISGWIDHFNPFSSLPVRRLPHPLMKGKVDLRCVALLCFAFPPLPVTYCPLSNVLEALCESTSVLAQRFMKWDSTSLLRPVPVPSRASVSPVPRAAGGVVLCGRSLLLLRPPHHGVLALLRLPRLEPAVAWTWPWGINPPKVPGELGTRAA